MEIEFLALSLFLKNCSGKIIIKLTFNGLVWKMRVTELNFASQFCQIFLKYKFDLVATFTFPDLKMMEI